MRAFHGSASNIQGRADDFIYAQSFRSDRRADDVNHRIHSADLVEMDSLHGHVMNLCFSCSQCLKDGDGSLLCGLRNPRRGNDVTNLAQPTMRMRMRM